MHAVGEQNDQNPFDDMEELGWVAHGRGVRQRIKQLVERRVTAETNQYAEQRHAAPKPEEFFLCDRENRVLLSECLQNSPQRD
jgi:hypothetical protein